LAAVLNYIAETYITSTIALPDRQEQSFTETRRLALPDYNWNFQLSPLDVWQQFSLMGITGREWYLVFNLIDLIVYQWLANGCLSMAHHLIFEYYWLPLVRDNRRARLQVTNFMQWAVWLAKWELVADSVENLAVLTTLLTYPNRIPWILVLLSIVSPLKWVLVIACLMSIIVAAVMFIRERRKLNNRKRLPKKVK
jgi:hypothetical protein